MDEYQHQEDTFTNKNNTDIKDTANEIRKKVAKKTTRGRPKKETRKYEPLQKEEPLINDLEKYQNEPIEPEPEPEPKPEPEPIKAVEEKPVLPVINEEKPLPEIERITEEDVFEYLLFKEFKKTMKNKKPIKKVEPEPAEPEQAEDVEEVKPKRTRKRTVKTPRPEPKPSPPDFLQKFTTQYGDLF